MGGTGGEKDVALSRREFLDNRGEGEKDAYSTNEKGFLLACASARGRGKERRGVAVLLFPQEEFLTEKRFRAGTGQRPGEGTPKGSRSDSAARDGGQKGERDPTNLKIHARFSFDPILRNILLSGWGGRPISPEQLLHYLMPAVAAFLCQDLAARREEGGMSDRGACLSWGMLYCPDSFWRNALAGRPEKTAEEIPDRDVFALLLQGKGLCGSRGSAQTSTTGGGGGGGGGGPGGKREKPICGSNHERGGGKAVPGNLVPIHIEH